MGSGPLSLLKASQSFTSADVKAVKSVFCRDLCATENTLRGVSVGLSAISGQLRRRAKRSFLEKVAKPLFRQSQGPEPLGSGPCRVHGDSRFAGRFAPAAFRGGRSAARAPAENGFSSLCPSGGGTFRGLFPRPAADEKWRTRTRLRGSKPALEDICSERKRATSNFFQFCIQTCKNCLHMKDTRQKYRGVHKYFCAYFTRKRLIFSKKNEFQQGNRVKKFQKIEKLARTKWNPALAKKSYGKRP